MGWGGGGFLQSYGQYIDIKAEESSQMTFPTYERQNSVLRFIAFKYIHKYLWSHDASKALYREDGRTYTCNTLI